VPVVVTLSSVYSRQGIDDLTEIAKRRISRLSYQKVLRRIVRTVTETVVFPP
jgi:hypothetical protein